MLWRKTQISDLFDEGKQRGEITRRKSPRGKYLSGLQLRKNGKRNNGRRSARGG